MFTLGKKKKVLTSQEAYIDALKRMIDGNEEGAFQALQTAVKGGRAPTDAYIRLGNLLRERGAVSKAVQIHQSLTVKTNLTKDEKIELFLNLAEDYARLGNSQKSVKVLETAAKTLNIKDSLVFLKIAKQYHVMGETEKTYDALKEARKHGGIGEREVALYLCTLGEGLMEKDDHKEAKKILQRALKHDSNCAPALMTLGGLAEESGNIDEAIELWKRVTVLSPQLSESALHKLERVLFEKGRFSEIETIYNDVRAARGSDEAASVALGAFFEKQGRGDEAIQLLEDYLTVCPESLRGRLLLVSLYGKYRDPDILDRFLDESIKQPWQRKPFVCQTCQFQSDTMRWHCPRCNVFDSFSTDYEI
jgi:lipopolysaccharide biosynthesis regulator YciM